jgi:hypothetical protein
MHGFALRFEWRQTDAKRRGTARSRLRMRACYLSGYGGECGAGAGMALLIYVFRDVYDANGGRHALGKRGAAA